MRTKPHIEIKDTGSLDYFELTPEEAEEVAEALRKAVQMYRNRKGGVVENDKQAV